MGISAVSPCVNDNVLVSRMRRGRRTICRTLRRRFMTDTETIGTYRRVVPSTVVNYVLTHVRICPRAYDPSSMLRTLGRSRVGLFFASIRIHKCCPDFVLDCFRRGSVGVSVLPNSRRVLLRRAISCLSFDCCVSVITDKTPSGGGRGKGFFDNIGGPCLRSSS